MGKNARDFADRRRNSRDTESGTAWRGKGSAEWRLKGDINVLGLLMGLLGAVLGAGIALMGVQWQIQAAADQSHLNFMNEKRIDAYASWLDAITELSVKEEAAFDALDASLDGSTSATTEIVAVREQLRRMKSLEVQISIVGSKAVMAESRGMIAAHQELAGRLTKLRNDPSLAPTFDVPPRDGGRTTSEERPSIREATESVRRSLEALAREQREESKGTDAFQQLADITDEQQREFEKMIEAVAALESSSRAFAINSLQLVSVQYDAFVDAAQNDLQIQP